MIRFQRLSAAVLAVLCVSALGCAGSQENVGEYVGDAAITATVKSSIAADPVVKATEVNVETLKGQVQLSGFVSSYAAMTKAVEITRGVIGVTSVRNDMRLKQ